MKNNFQIGDVVRISESSPLMTIIGLGECSPVPIAPDILMPPSPGLNEVECSWWDSNKNDFCDAVFPMECLQLVNHNVIITTFQIGDVVQLASGGLKMTISYLGDSHSTHNELDVLLLSADSNEVKCIWWNNNKNDFASKVFPLQCLQLINHNVVSTSVQIGDVVQLASGSPDFQVMSIDNDDLSLIEVQHPEKPFEDYNINLFLK